MDDLILSNQMEYKILTQELKCHKLVILIL
jgi:hypothetical protein